MTIYDSGKTAEKIGKYSGKFILYISSNFPDFIEREWKESNTYIWFLFFRFGSPEDKKNRGLTPLLSVDSLS